MPEDIADTYAHISSVEDHRLDQSPTPAGLVTQAVVGTTTPVDAASTAPIDIPPPDVEQDAIPGVDPSLKAAAAVDASTVPPAEDQAENDTPQSSLDQAQGKIALDEATLKSLTQCILTGLREAKAESTNNWAEINGALKDIDDEKIGSCKEDIDTLLTFAGLFSAALTAFVVESYQQLSPDPTDQMIQLLTQIAVQTNGYTVSASHANATLSGLGTTQPPFEPSPSAVLVNKLWFASLVLALITTSFGILIKQWLREYRAVNPEHSNIRSRLRIRQFRYPGLLKWRVFEFAAFLPLLIQLALGLFLLGLCIFTWAINPSIGRTLTVLVAAWIFFLVAFTFAPVTSAECPYKISLFSRVYPALRSGLTSLWSLNWMYIGPRHEKSRIPWLEQLVYIYIALVPFYTFIGCIVPKFTKLLSYLTKGYIQELETKLEFRDLSWHNIQDAFGNPRPSPLEETNIAGDTSKDLDMLSTVDDILLDDELLSTTMRTVIKRDPFQPENIVDFVRSILAHRAVQPASGPEGLLNLAPLSTRVADAALDMLSIGIRNYAPDRAPGPWARDVLTLLVSLSARGPIISADLKSLVLSFSSHFAEVPGLSPGVLPGVSLQDLAAGIQYYFPSICVHPTIIGRIHAARYCRSDCQHKSLVKQFDAHHWASEDDHGVILRLTKDVLDESVKQPALSKEVTELLWAALSSNLWGNLNLVAGRRLSWHLVSVLQEAPWSHAKSFATSAYMPFGSRLMSIMARASTEEHSSDLNVTLQVDQPVTASNLTRFLRLFTFALVHCIENGERLYPVWEMYPNPVKSLPELWSSQHRRFTSTPTSLWSHLKECSTELTAVLYLLVALAEEFELYRREISYHKVYEERSYLAEDYQMERTDYFAAANLWCDLLAEITANLQGMEPCANRVLVWLRPLALTDDIRIRIPPPLPMPNISDEEEKQAKAAVAMVLGIFKSNSIEEPGPISLVDLEAWRSNEANTPWEWPKKSQENPETGESQERIEESRDEPAGLVKRTFQTVRRGLSKIPGAVCSSSNIEESNEEHELASSGSGPAGADAV